ncbi:MAG: 16S rRNA (guanine(527)-N(7))-methyltransferase RsmG [Phycisphaerae bacterium]|nr:16S rRNA (guanine(527)-N(7))-methyltransferase RsmG [Phycisphaerae bacterium]
MSTSDEDRFRSALADALGAGVPAPDEAQVGLMYAYFAGVVEANQRFNLTRITDPAEAAVKHFADALFLLGWVENAGARVRRVLDVGTGAGFPAAPLAIMRPHWQVVAIDSTGKKVRFVADMSARVGLHNLTAEQHRAGEWKPQRRFDLVLYKAVGSLRKCVEQSHNLVKRGGYIVAYKTRDISDDERREGVQTARRHRITVLDPYPYRLRAVDQALERVLWVFRKQDGKLKMGN